GTRGRARHSREQGPPAPPDRAGRGARDLRRAHVRQPRRALLGQRSPRGRAHLAPRTGWRRLARKGERRLAFPTVLNTSGTRGGTRTASRATRSERREEVPGRLPVLALLEVPGRGLPRARSVGSRE